MEIEIKHHDGVPSYNGYSSVYEALYNGEQEFRDLDFANRMWTVAEILNNIENPVYVPQTLEYTFKKSPKGMEMKVLDPDGETVVSYNGPALPYFMEHELDLDGLHTFLVYHEKVHPDDKLIWVDG